MIPIWTADLRSLDTNVLARWVLGDDPAQTAVAEALLADVAWVSHTVFIELGWVLNKARRLPRVLVADMLQQVLELETIRIQDRDALIWAIDRYRQGADWGDVMHLVSSMSDSDAFTTFDRRLAAWAGAESPLPIETLRA